MNKFKIITNIILTGQKKKKKGIELLLKFRKNYYEPHLWFFYNFSLFFTSILKIVNKWIQNLLLDLDEEESGSIFAPELLDVSPGNLVSPSACLLTSFSWCRFNMISSCHFWR